VFRSLFIPLVYRRRRLKIMRDEDPIRQNLETKQDLFFRACAKRGLTIAGMAAAAGIEAGTLGTYKPTHGRKASLMPLWAFIRLAGFVPTDLMSILIEDSGHQLAPIDPQAADWLGLGARAGAFASKVCEFQATGGHIDHREAAVLREDMLVIISEGQGAVTGAG
jgi:hypothetical protein